MSEERCGCCEGLEKLIPMPTANRPGLDALAYRVGTHATFLETMKARLTDHFLEVPLDELDEEGQHKTAKVRPLKALTTRDSSDPSIALLDAWATLGDVLTFYQERIANEGYLRTATERRSILELARLVGYKPRPGVAASVYLAFTLEEGAEVEIPAGTRAQSLPAPGELPQPFETSEPLLARAEWNELKPRLTRPQKITPDDELTLCFRGVATNLKPNDPILIDFGDYQGPYRVEKVDPDPAADRTKVVLRAWKPSQTAATAALRAFRAIPENLHAAALRGLATGLREIGDLPVDELPGLVEQVAAALLAVFNVLAQMPPSPKRDEAIAEIVRALKSLRATLEKIKANSPPSLLVNNLDRIMAWVDRALVILETGKIPRPPVLGTFKETSLENLVADLLKPLPATAIPPRSAFHLIRDLKASFAPDSDLGPRLLTHLQPVLKPLLYKAWRHALVTAPSKVKVYAFRLRAAPFGYNAPPRPDYFDWTRRINIFGEWSIDDPLNEETSQEQPSVDIKAEPDSGPAPLHGDAEEVRRATVEAYVPRHHEQKVIYLDSDYEIMSDSWVVIATPNDILPVTPKEDSVSQQSLVAYGLSGKATRLDLGADDPEWIGDPSSEPFSTVRSTTVYAQSELLDPAEEPIDTIATPVAGDCIELDGLYHGLESGRWLIVSGERTDISGVTGVTDSELVMLANVEQGFDSTRPGDTTHTTLVLANSLAYTYKRDTVTIYGNVVKATHGETRTEVLGGGDGSQALQRFELRQSPLTYLAAPTPAGAESTLKVYVSDVRWHEADHLAGLGPTERRYITRTDDESKTTVVFGDGEHGARPPTGVENVTASYRTGIGKPGNVAAEQLRLLATRPLGVKSVINPLPASGGADRESRDQARRNVPMALMALDRLVSVQDYADFARTYAGIGKASAIRLSDGHAQVVHVTIAGAEDIPIDLNSDLYRNLCQALHRFGGPQQPIRVALRELMLLVISAGVRLHPDYKWESVVPEIRTALLDAFSFEHRDLGQDVQRSEVIKVIQGVRGVVYVDVDIFDRVHQDITPEQLEKLTDPENPDRLGLQKRIEVKLARPGEQLTGHLVQPGDTLWGLAQRYGTTVGVLLRLNKDKISDPDVIYAGDTLLVRRERVIKPAQLAYLSPDLTDTLILTELTS